MLPARIALTAAVSLLLGACATAPKKADTQSQDNKALGERISRICALPESERTAELEKLKTETGMVLYCGK